MRNRTRSIIAAISALALATAAGGVASAQGLFGSAGDGSSGILGSLGDLGSLGSPAKPTIPGDGLFDVSAGEVEPGIYRNPGIADTSCFWARTGPLIDGFSPFDNAVDPFQYATAVIIEPTDTEFFTDNCATWEWVAPVPDTTGSDGSLGSLGKPSIPGEGTFDVGNGLFGTVKPGIYQNPGLIDQDCDWERVGPNFETGYEIDPFFGDQVASAVIIEPTDTTFTTTDCATWEWVAPVPDSTG
ncbi:hypothetical protein [Rhodococcus sp. NPDC049939]|uniref:hypothetical protein n=1 Tax=Rhodococcus sp. NPDC049939 TaxID=3155511 RepID=UPI0033DDA13C